MLTPGEPNRPRSLLELAALLGLAEVVERIFSPARDPLHALSPDQLRDVEHEIQDALHELAKARQA